MKPGGRPTDAAPDGARARRRPTKGDLSLWWASGVFSVGASAARRRTRRGSSAGYAASTAPGGDGARGGRRAGRGRDARLGRAPAGRERADAHDRGGHGRPPREARLLARGCRSRATRARCSAAPSTRRAGRSRRRSAADCRRASCAAHAPDAHPFFESTPIVAVRSGGRSRPSASATSISPPPALLVVVRLAPAASAVRVQSPR